jgi:hypothetical protein
LSDWLLVQSTPASVAPVLVGRPRPAVDPKTRLRGFPDASPAGNVFTIPEAPFVEFRLRLKHPCRNLAEAVSRRGPSHGLCFPTALAESKSLSAVGLPAGRGTPPGFDYPLDVLLPSKPRRFCFTPAALLGFTLRSVPLSQGNRRFPAGMTHLPLAAAQEMPEDKSERATTPVSGLCSLRESLAPTPVFSGAAAGCSLGVSPSRACRQQALSGISPELLSRAWPTQTALAQPAPQSIDQPAASPLRAENGKPPRTERQPS